MGLLFGSAGAHTYLKSGQVAPAPSIKPQLQDPLSRAFYKYANIDNF